MSKGLALEIAALVLVVLAVGHLALPMLEGFFMPVKPYEVVIRLYVAEYLGFDPREIVLKKGQRVRLILVGMDVGHGFSIPELGVDAGLILPGEKKVIEFTPDKAGTFVFFCTVYCSPMHPLMRGKIIVVD